MKRIINELSPVPSKKYNARRIVTNLKGVLLSEQIPYNRLVWKVRIGVYYEPLYLHPYLHNLIKKHDINKTRA